MSDQKNVTCMVCWCNVLIESSTKMSTEVKLSYLNFFQTVSLNFSPPSLGSLRLTLHAVENLYKSIWNRLNKCLFFFLNLSSTEYLSTQVWCFLIVTTGVLEANESTNLYLFSYIYTFFLFFLTLLFSLLLYMYICIHIYVYIYTYNIYIYIRYIYFYIHYIYIYKEN